MKLNSSDTAKVKSRRSRSQGQMKIRLYHIVGLAMVKAQRPQLLGRCYCTLHTWIEALGPKTTGPVTACIYLLWNLPFLCPKGRKHRLDRSFVGKSG